MEMDATRINAGNMVEDSVRSVIWSPKPPLHRPEVAREEKPVVLEPTVKRQKVGTKAKDLPYKQTVKKITEHRTANRTGVQFQVYWEGYPNIPGWERSPFVLSKPRGEEVLRDYLRSLKGRRLTHLLNRQPDLADLIESR